MKKEPTLSSLAQKDGKSFTVIELLLVIAIMGFVASFTMIMVRSTKEKARIAGLIQFSASIKRAFFIDIVGEWEFEDNLNDGSGNNLNGTWKGGGSYVPNDASSQFGKAAQLNGNNYIKIMDPGENSILDIKDKITVESWIKINDFGSKPWLCIVCKDGAYELKIRNNGQASFRLYGEDGSQYNIQPSEDVFKFGTGKWHHYVGTWNGSEMKIYIDGEERGDPLIFWGRIKENAEDLKFGKDVIGVMDNVRLYNTSFSQ
jgi:type II secretory pathway pseudopilin PulG